MSSIKYHPEIEKLEHDDASAPETKRVLAYGWDTSGLQKVKLNVDANGKLNVNSTASLAGTTLPISGATEGVGVAILDGSGNQITSFGGGTQYTEGDTDATLTGTISMAEGPSNTVTPLQVDASKHLQVDIAAASTDITVQDGGGSLTVDGTVGVSGTVTADTELPTAVALADLSSNPTTTAVGSYLYAFDNGTGYNRLGLLNSGADGQSGGRGLTVGSMLFNGTSYDRERGDATNGTLVNLGSNNDVTVSNAAGASAVNIQDGGNTITVDYATTGSGTATGALRVELPTNGTGVIATVGAVTAITNALPAGTNAIGKLSANSGVDIGDTDVTSVVPGTGATNLGKAEDAAHTTGDTGVMMLGVRSASPTDRSAGPTDGDYEPFALNEVGAIWVSETSSINGGDSTATASTADGSTALTNSAQVIKASAGKLTGYYIYNPNSSATYVNFYNTAAASVTVGTTNPLFNICIPATSAANLSGLKTTFGTAMSWSATTTGGGNTAPSTALEATCWYK